MTKTQELQKLADSIYGENQCKVNYDQKFKEYSLRVGSKPKQITGNYTQTKDKLEERLDTKRKIES